MIHRPAPAGIQEALPARNGAGRTARTGWLIRLTRWYCLAHVFQGQRAAQLPINGRLSAFKLVKDSRPAAPMPARRSLGMGGKSFRCSRPSDMCQVLD